MENLSLEVLAEQMKKQQETIQKQNETIGALQATALKAEVKEVKPITVPKETVKVNGKEYKFQVGAFHFPGSDKKYIAEEVLQDKAILQKIVAIEGQGLLKELV